MKGETFLVLVSPTKSFDQLKFDLLLFNQWTGQREIEPASKL